MRKALAAHGEAVVMHRLAQQHAPSRRAVATLVVPRLAAGERGIAEMMNAGNGVIAAPRECRGQLGRHLRPLQLRAPPLRISIFPSHTSRQRNPRLRNALIRPLGLGDGQLNLSQRSFVESPARASAHRRDEKKGRPRGGLFSISVNLKFS